MSVFVMERAGRWGLRGVLVAVYWFSIVIAELNFGAVELQTVALFCMPVFLLIAVCALSGRIPERTKGVIVSAMVLLVCALILVALQSSPLPFHAFAMPAWQDVQNLSPKTGSFISLSPGDDWASALRIALPIGIFILSLQLFDTDERALGALKTLAVSGGIVAILSILQFEIAPDTLLFWQKPAYFDSLTGFFVNRNTAATYFGLMVVVNLALLFHALGDPRDRRDLLRWWYVEPKRAALGYAIWLLSALVALMLTGSRAGLLSCIIAVAGLFICRAFRRSRRRRTAMSAPVGRAGSFLRRSARLVLVIIALAAIVQVLGGRTLLRAEIGGVGDTRYCVMPGILSAIANQLPFGAGLASFEDAFAAYRDPGCGLYGVWNRAHNVYLEGLFTLGIPFVFLAGFALLALARVFATGLKKRRGLRYAPEIGVCAVLLVVVHSAFDFSLQISGMAVIFCALLGPLVSISLNPPGKAAPAP